jgi:quinolinate synthase
MSMKIPITKPYFGEEERRAILEPLETGWVVQGPKVAEFERRFAEFCGVKFMAETAKILNPAKTVLVPSEKAGCSLAASITAEDVRRLKQQYPGAPVVSYVNTYADVKAESDICCTSGNAVAVVNSLESEAIIFLPRIYLLTR